MGQFYEAVEVKSVSYIEQSQDVGDARVIGELQEDLQTGNGTSPRERQAEKLKGWTYLSPLI